MATRKNKSKMGIRSRNKRGGANKPFRNNKKSLKTIKKIKNKNKHGGGGYATPYNKKLRQYAIDGNLDGIKALFEETHDQLGYILTTPHIDSTDEWSDETALFLAAEAGHKHIVEYLLLKKPKLIQTYSDGNAFDIAAKNGFKDIIELLFDYYMGKVSNGFNYISDDNLCIARTAMMYAYKSEHLEIIDAIVDKFKEFYPTWWENNEKPRCMEVADYEQCDGDGEKECAISKTKLSIEHAIKLPGSDSNRCFSREALYRWFERSKTDPFTRAPISNDWIEDNKMNRPYFKCYGPNPQPPPPPPRRSSRRPPPRRSSRRPPPRRSSRRSPPRRSSRRRS